MSADVLPFPTRQLKAPGPVVVRIATDNAYDRAQLAYTAAHLAAASAEVTGAMTFILEGNELDETSAIRDGGTLEIVLEAALRLCNLRGRAEDTECRAAIRQHLAHLRATGGDHA